MKRIFNAYTRFKCPFCGFDNPDYVVNEEGEAQCIKCRETFKADANTFSAFETVSDLFATFIYERTIAFITFIFTMVITLSYAIVTLTRINGW